jgi:Biopolymer transport protein
MQNNDAGPRLHAHYGGSLTQSIYSSHLRKPAQLMLVPMIDIFTVLVTFLLMTAVFSRITILQLDLPSSTAAPSTTTPTFRLEVIVRQEGFELTNGESLIAAVPKVNGEYDLKTLSELALALKRDNPEANDASVLLEKDVAYDYLIQTMDAIRSAEVPAGADAAATLPAASGPSADAAAHAPAKPTRVPLFANIAVGEAP